MHPITITLNQVLFWGCAIIVALLLASSWDLHYRKKPEQGNTLFYLALIVIGVYIVGGWLNGVFISFANALGGH